MAAYRLSETLTVSIKKWAKPPLATVRFFSSSVPNQRLIGTTDENLIAVDLRESWDWKTNISERVIVKQKNPRTGTAPPFLSRGVLYQGTENDENIYFWGGTVSSINTSFPGWVAAQPAVYSLWSFNTRSEQWNQFDVHLDVPNRPSSASSAEAPDLGLAFYFNGEIDSGSALGSGIRAPNDKVFLEGMVILDTKNQTARNVSTKAVSGDLPRSRGRMQYVPGIGKKGILVQIGGNQKPVDDTQDRHVGDLVCFAFNLMLLFPENNRSKDTHGSD